VVAYREENLPKLKHERFSFLTPEFLLSVCGEIDTFAANFVAQKLLQADLKDEAEFISFLR